MFGAYASVYRQIFLAAFVGSLPSVISNLIFLFGYGRLVRCCQGWFGISDWLQPYDAQWSAILYWIGFYTLAWALALFLVLAPISLILRRWRVAAIGWQALLLGISLYFWVQDGGLSVGHGPLLNIFQLGYYLPLFATVFVFLRLR